MQFDSEVNKLTIEKNYDVICIKYKISGNLVDKRGDTLLYRDRDCADKITITFTSDNNFRFKRTIPYKEEALDIYGSWYNLYNDINLLCEAKNRLYKRFICNQGYRIDFNNDFNNNDIAEIPLGPHAVEDIFNEGAKFLLVVKVKKL